MATKIEEYELHAILRDRRIENMRSVPVVNPLSLADGTVLSVQASEFHYCTPKQTGLSAYWTYEVGIGGGGGGNLRHDPDAPFNHRTDDPDSDSPVYGYVPASEIVEYINLKGGLSS